MQQLHKISVVLMLLLFALCTSGDDSTEADSTGEDDIIDFDIKEECEELFNICKVIMQSDLSEDIDFCKELIAADCAMYVDENAETEEGKNKDGENEGSEKNENEETESGENEGQDNENQENESQENESQESESQESESQEGESVDPDNEEEE